MSIPKFSGRKIVAHFGGVSTTAQKLRSVGFKTSDKRVQQWQQRDQVPSNGLAALQVYADENNVRFVTSDFLTR